MAEIALIGGFILVLVLVIVFAFRHLKKKNKERKELFKEWGVRLNLQLTEGKNGFNKLQELSGDYKGDHVSIYESITGSGKNRTTITTISFGKSPHNFQFRIGKENFFTRIGKKVGFKDIEFDNLELDKKFLFKSKDESQFRLLMDYNILHDLEGVASKIQGTIVNSKDAVMSYTIYGVMHKPEKMEELVEVLKFMSKLMQKGK